MMSANGYCGWPGPRSSIREAGTAMTLAAAALSKDICYPGAPHGMFAMHEDKVNADLLSFCSRSGP